MFLNACTHPSELAAPDTGYPPEIETLVINKCSNSGCHNFTSHEAAGGLNMETWNNLFQGSRGGAVVIPFRSDFSTMCFYTNTDTLLGTTLVPTMPYNSTPLSLDEYSLIKNWIDNGAPDKNGFIKFSDYQNKSKLYICNRGCDVITILDPESGLAMRYIDVGTDAAIEKPVMTKVSPDKLFWYVIFESGTTIQKFRTADNIKVGELNIGPGFWSSFVISSDSKKAFISNNDYNGSILYVDIENMQLITTYQSGLQYPLDLCINHSGNKLYVTSKEGNFIYKLDLSDPIYPVVEQVSLQTGSPASSVPTLNPYSILLSQDESRYYVVCKKSAELRIVQDSNDSLLNTFTTGSNPAEMTYSPNFPYLIISCLGVPGTNKLSVIDIFDVNSETFLPEINAGFDSKGIMIDESSSKLYVANRNVNVGGPNAHHEAACNGKNGFITAIDLNTMQLIPGYKAELSVEPFHISK